MWYILFWHVLKLFILFVRLPGVWKGGSHCSGGYQWSSCNSRSQVSSNWSSGTTQDICILLTHDQGARGQYASSWCHHGKGSPLTKTVVVHCFTAMCNLIVAELVFAVCQQYIQLSRPSRVKRQAASQKESSGGDYSSLSTYTTAYIAEYFGGPAIFTPSCRHFL